MNGAGEWTRTTDLLITNQLLCQTELHRQEELEVYNYSSHWAMTSHSQTLPAQQGNVPFYQKGGNDGRGDNTVDKKGHSLVKGNRSGHLEAWFEAKSC